MNGLSRGYYADMQIVESRLIALELDVAKCKEALQNITRILECFCGRFQSSDPILQT